MLSDTDQHEFITASCEGKPSFPSFALAAKVAKRGRAKKHLNAMPYRCEWCGLWHVGTRMKGRRG